VRGAPSVNEKGCEMRLLAARESCGIIVRLFWDEEATTGSDVVVEYRDRSEDVAYFLHPPRDRALDAFYHPNAYRRSPSFDQYSIRVA
jgi:hypothetical protein